MKLNMFQRAIYYILNFTWGLPMTLIGGLVALVLIIAGEKPRKRTSGIAFRVWSCDWGGFSLGPVVVTDTMPTESLVNHEIGHSCQNAVYGPFMIFISIASCVRYWYRELFRDKVTTDYDDIWFEGQATKWGNWLAERW
jgi:hypothetical protein